MTPRNVQTVEEVNPKEEENLSALFNFTKEAEMAADTLIAFRSRLAEKLKFVLQPGNTELQEYCNRFLDAYLTEVFSRTEYETPAEILD